MTGKLLLEVLRGVLIVGMAVAKDFLSFIILFALFIMFTWISVDEKSTTSKSEEKGKVGK